MGSSSSPPPSRDYAAEMAAVSKMADQMAASASASSLKTNQGMIDQALTATDAISGKLDNSYTQKALAQVNGAAGQLAPMQALSAQMTGLSDQALAGVGSTDIERQLHQQALSDLALGSQLTPEQQRAAEQGARVGFAARGMATGAPSAAAEILNRDAFAQNRLDSRRAFAGTVNQAETQNSLNRMQTAGALLGQSMGANQNIAQLGQSLGQSYLTVDPYQRALGSNIPTASQGPSAQLTGQIYGNAMNYGSDLFNTNYNAQWSNYLNGQNNALALQMGGMQQASAKNAANSSLMGAGIGAAGSVGGAAIAAYGTYAAAGALAL